jgi:hypothetical protein
MTATHAQLDRMIQRNQQGQYNSDWGNCGQNAYNCQPSLFHIISHISLQDTDILLLSSQAIRSI